MKTMSKSPARGDSCSRSLYEATLTTEKKIILPTLSNPVVVQRLTRQQIAAIPRDKYAVRVIAQITPPSTTRKAPKVSKRVRARHHHFYPILRSRNCKKKRSKTKFEEEWMVMIELMKQVHVQFNKVEQAYRESQLNHGGGDDTPPEFDIFRSPIDEDKMADCILNVKEGFFGCHDTCTIGKKECNITDFCLLVHFAFRKMNLLNNYFRKPFCEYLQTKVLMNDEKLKVKNFNNYANSQAYKKLEKDLAHECFNLEERLPKHENPLFLACHDIARAFHESKYFSQLRTGKNNFKDLIL